MEVVNQKENELHVYSINENEYVGVINTSSFDHHNNVIPIVILDCSSAAGDAPARLVKEVLPLVMSKVKNWSSSVQLITFGEESVHKSLSKTELSEFDLQLSGEVANIGPAIEKLRSYFEACAKTVAYSFDVLTISAGEISYREHADWATKKLIDFLPTTDAWRINSQAVRLFTTSNNHQPDTKALSYLLQINNSTEANFCDINVTSSNDTIANEIAGLFPDNVQERSCIHVDKPDQPIILRFPWRSSQHRIFPLTTGWNIFWLTELPDEVNLYPSSISPINVLVRGQLTLEKFQQLMEQKLPQILSHMKILKIVGTTEANETVDQIFSYFAKTEDALALKCSTPNDKLITNALAEIAMHKFDFRDSAEIIEFHRKPTRTIETEREKERLKREEEEDKRRQQEEEEERHKREEEERHKREEEERLKREEEERLKREEEERLKLEEEERLKLEEEERLKLEEEERLKREEEERLKLEEEERLKLEEEERLKLEEEERLKLEEEERLKLEEEERLKRDEQATSDAHKIDSNSIPNSVQTVFILDENSSGANESQRVMKKIMPLMLSKLFHSNLQFVHHVTFVRYKSTADEMLRSLVQALDATKRIRISVLTNGEVQEMEYFSKMVIECLHKSGYSFQLQVVRLAATSPTTKRYQLVDINVNDSNEFIAQQLCFKGQSDDLRLARSADHNWIFYLIIFLIFYYYFCFY